jgi:hypothetical protein
MSSVISNERARDILLNRLHDLKLDHCESVTDYTNQVRQIEAAIARGKAMKKSGCEHVVSHIIFDCLEIRLDLADLVGVVGQRRRQRSLRIYQKAIRSHK